MTYTDETIKAYQQRIEELLATTARQSMRVNIYATAFDELAGVAQRIVGNDRRHPDAAAALAATIAATRNTVAERIETVNRQCTSKLTSIKQKYAVTDSDDKAEPVKYALPVIALPVEELP